MRIPSAAGDGEMRVNMTPMIDVVFLLIIFFLVSSHLARQESQMELPLPTAVSGVALDDFDHARVVINVLENGTMLLAGRRATVSELQRRLQHERRLAGAHLEVRLRSDRHVPFHFVQPILLAVSRAGIRNVTFAVIRPADGCAAARSR